MKKSIGEFTLAMALGFTFLASGSLAFAAEPGKKVTYRDLDLGQPSEVVILYERIRDAARLVCVEDSAPWDGRHVTSYHRCHAAAVEEAVRKVNDVALTSLHRSNDRAIASR